MKIIVFSESDYNFSAKLSKLCDSHSDDLIFFNNFDSLKKFKNKKNILLIIDFNDYYDRLDFVINSIKDIDNFPCCILIDKMESKIQKKVTDLGFDIIMTKQLFLMNLKTIKSQVLNSNPKA